MEYAIQTRPAVGKFESLPNCYKVDLASPEHKLAIEVDGKTHKLKRWKFLDRRKTAVLNFLGWKVLRFWNEEVSENPRAIAEKIRLYMT
jgi:very-short-patch-repair endonuclease